MSLVSPIYARRPLSVCGGSELLSKSHPLVPFIQSGPRLDLPLPTRLSNALRAPIHLLKAVTSLGWAGTPNDRPSIQISVTENVLLTEPPWQAAGVGQRLDQVTFQSSC